jgi:hypothetical protein
VFAEESGVQSLASGIRYEVGNLFCTVEFEICDFFENAVGSENYGPEHDSDFYSVTPATPATSL